VNCNCGAAAEECCAFNAGIQVEKRSSFQNSRKEPESSSTAEAEDHVHCGFHLDRLIIEQVGPVTP
jgi:hypothetical protein